MHPHITHAQLTSRPTLGPGLHNLIVLCLLHYPGVVAGPGVAGGLRPQGYGQLRGRKGSAADHCFLCVPKRIIWVQSATGLVRRWMTVWIGLTQHIVFPHSEVKLLSP